MQNRRTISSEPPAPPIAVSPDNPCPFLRALVAGRFCRRPHRSAWRAFQDHRAGERRDGTESKIKAGCGTYLVALIANGLSPLRLLSSWWSGAMLDELRNGPLDKHGAGSRILDATRACP